MARPGGTRQAPRRAGGPRAGQGGVAGHAVGGPARLVHLQGREGRTALLVAAHQGHDRLLEWLIRARADLADSAGDGAGDGPLHYAALGDRPRTALTLANPGAEVNAPNLERRTVLHLAVVNRRQELVKALLKVEADGSLLDVRGDSALHLALQQGDTAVLDLQLEGGAHCLLALLARDLATANVVSRDGDSALHLAEGLPV
jgi:ankyrin repeat protein